MSRQYTLRDAIGERHWGELERPLLIGGSESGGLVLPDVAQAELYATVAQLDGHAYIQPAADQTGADWPGVYLNDEKLSDSAWLKSGDQIQIGSAMINWTVNGDRVTVEVTTESRIQNPGVPSPRAGPVINEMPVHERTDKNQPTRKFRGPGITLAGALLFMLVYLLASTSVGIRLKPAADSISLEGFPPPIPLRDSFLAIPGDYTLHARRQGYAPLTEMIRVQMGKPVSLDYLFTELPGQLEISTLPVTNISLWVDGVETPLGADGRAHLTRGEHSIQLKSTRYLSHDQQIEIEGYGRIQKLDVVLKPAWAMVSISSLPAGAEVLVNGESKGTTPLTIELLQGRPLIELNLEKHKAASIQPLVQAGVDRELEAVPLQWLDGTLNLSSQPTQASIILDGEFKGTTPITLSLQANHEHHLRLSKSGSMEVEKLISVSPEETRALKLDLPASFGTVFLTTSPNDAILKIDGKVVGRKNGRLRLSTRPHTLTLGKPGYIDQTVMITPRIGASQNLNITLASSKAQAAKAQTASHRQIISTVSGQTLQLIQPDALLKMGASRREAGRRANESRRLVSFTRPFYFAQRETTNRDYRLYRATHDSGTVDGANLNSDAQPVVKLSWDDAARYCNWLSEQQGLPAAYEPKNGSIVAVQPMNTGYRLPTEAEWAWVARRQGQAVEQRYPWIGTYPPTAVTGNYADTHIADTLADVVPGYNDGYRGSSPVASFADHPAGFYDLGGNVAEWVHDYYAIYPGEASTAVIDPPGPPSGTHHVVRGAGWRHGNITELRLSYRDYSNVPRADLGFRIARYAE